MAKLPNFRSLYFGESSAEEELVEDPERFMSTYYDRWDIASLAARHKKFLVIGPKGSGKSAAAAYLEQLLIRRKGPHSVFSKFMNLNEASPNLVPLSSLNSKNLSESGQGTTDSAWRLFLLLRILNLVIQDQASELHSNPDILDALDRLRDAGLLAGDFRHVLKQVRESKFSVGVKGLGGESKRTSAQNVPITFLSEWILERLKENSSKSSYLLVLDGLDYIIGNNKPYWLALAALLRAGHRLHYDLRALNSDTRLLVLCRSDVFRKISFADADKIASTALYADWGTYQTRASDSPLWDYLGHKTGLPFEDLLSYFPDKVVVGERSAGNPKRISTPHYLLHATRSTPREMTMLFQRIREHVPSNGYINNDRVRHGVDEFASRDLLTGVLAEATGTIVDVLKASLENILSSLPSAKNVTKADLEKAVLAEGLTKDLVSPLAEFLFMAGLLGNYNPENEYVQFYHRRDTNQLRRDGPWQLHVALQYAFNVPYNR